MTEYGFIGICGYCCTNYSESRYNQDINFWQTQLSFVSGVVTPPPQMMLSFRIFCIYPGYFFLIKDPAHQLKSITLFNSKFRLYIRKRFSSTQVNQSVAMMYIATDGLQRGVVNRFHHVRSFVLPFFAITTSNSIYRL